MKIDVPPPPDDSEGKLRVYVGAWLFEDDLNTLTTIAADLGISGEEIVRRSIRLAGAMRALHSFHGITPPHQRVGDDPLEGAIW